MSPVPTITPRRVVIAGGGIAALEALLLLSDRGEHDLRLTLLSDRAHFTLRPQMIGEPWGGRALRADLRALTHEAGAFLAHERLVAVDPGEHVAVMASGARIPFDDLVVAVGAQPSLPFTGAQTIGFGSLRDALAASAKGRVAIVVPPGIAWSLPAYQLALHIAADAPGRVRVVTAEGEPLQIFGPEPARRVGALLDEHRVNIQTRSELRIGSDVSHLADTVLALPLLRGPAIAGLPVDGTGFHPVDAFQRIRGADGIYVVGDATDGQVKQGGLAALQADVAAADITYRAGAPIEPEPYVPVLRGKLVAPDGETLFLRRTLDGTDDGRSSARPLWKPAGFLCAWRLMRWLEHHHNELDGDPLAPLAHPVQAP
jgi:sulfide:quinone oxidoreductase